MRRFYCVDVLKKQFLGQIKRCLLSRYFNQMISEEKKFKIISLNPRNKYKAFLLCVSL